MLLPVMRPYFPADPDDVDFMYRREYHLGGMEESPDEMADAVLRMMGGTLHPMMDAVRRTRPDS